MAKDPAFLFYTSDFLTGTMFMTNEQVGLYVRMLCAQHQHGGRIDTNVLRAQCDSITNGLHVFNKFEHDETGSFNKRLDHEINLRKKKSLKAADSVNKRWEKYREEQGYKSNTNVLQTQFGSNTNVLRSEDEDENENEDVIIGKGGVEEKPKIVEPKIEEPKKIEPEKKPTTRFIAPSLDDVKNYMLRRNSESGNIWKEERVLLEAQKYFDYYQSNGWKVGKNPMKDWQAAIRNWMNNAHVYNSQSNVRNQETQRTNGRVEPAPPGTPFGQL